MSDAELLREWYTETPEDKIHPWEDLNEADFYFVRAKAVNNALDQLATLTQERDALRASMVSAKELLKDCLAEAPLDFLGTGSCQKHADKWQAEWMSQFEEALSLLTPSGEAGKGGGVCG